MDLSKSQLGLCPTATNNGPNFAEIERKLRDEPTLDMCRAHGRTHKAYGWARSPWGHWTDEQKAAYNEGYSR